MSILDVEEEMIAAEMDRDHQKTRKLFHGLWRQYFEPPASPDMQTITSFLKMCCLRDGVVIAVGDEGGKTFEHILIGSLARQAMHAAKEPLPEAVVNLCKLHFGTQLTDPTAPLPEVRRGRWWYGGDPFTLL